MVGALATAVFAGASREWERVPLRHSSGDIAEAASDHRLNGGPDNGLLPPSINRELKCLKR